MSKRSSGRAAAAFLHPAPNDERKGTAEMDETEMLSTPKKGERPQKREINLLSAQIKDLEEQIETDRAASSRDISFWACMANGERVATMKARDDTDKLRDAICERGTFFAELQTILRTKKPRIHHDLPSNEWQSFHLPLDACSRSNAMHAILDREYRRLHHVLDDIRLSHQSEDTRWATTKQDPNGRSFLEIVELMHVAAPYDMVTNAAWHVVVGGAPSGEHADQSHASTAHGNNVEQIDEWTVYRVTTQTLPTRVCRAHRLHKRYTDDECDVITTRSILRDPLHPIPHKDDTLVENATSWIQVAAAGTIESRVTVCLRVDVGSADHGLPMACPSPVDNPAAHIWSVQGHEFVQALKAAVDNVVCLFKCPD
ncbi:Aste57867_23721 [Aphanomyces stellatus]|uniref:Aste57867_23721 protein n=1 Tax=Aphanomyces stellatus TaxID=120398 RepID=A0A485LSX9_9STRA|nr:hypothetical protein As57867_023649 [Aphanomyces stellatus]VFU00366.1 Aste57867_23721 [Aphanomyces stellatus]